MKVGDQVVSLGDNYMDAGSLGVIRSVQKKGDSVLVTWHHIVTEKDYGKKIRVSLYHTAKNLKVCTDKAMEPNLAFQLRIR